MPADLAGRLDLTPDVRMTSYTYSEVFGSVPAVVWQVPGVITLLANGPARLTVAARWGAIAAAGPRTDDVLELLRMEAPGERARLTVADAAAGGGPSWAGAGPRSARAGATLLISISPPAGCGLSTAAAASAAVALCLRDVAITGHHEAEPALSSGEGGPHALLDGKRFPFDLEAAGLRLALIDTRVRRAPRPTIAEQAPLEAVEAALNACDLAALGPMLTAAHQALPRGELRCDDELPHGELPCDDELRCHDELPHGEPRCDDEQEIAVSTALAAGALGARAIVDGPGRPVCALLPADRVTAVRAALRAEFRRRDLRTPRLLTISPAHGPRRFSSQP
ncbi:MAG TPA: hypothetical protein VF070_32985 [Streptosporangiaceae bacterium]